MFCTACGAKLSPGAAFCPDCGTAAGTRSDSPAAIATNAVRALTAPSSAKVSSLGHPKESTYFAFGAIVGALAWLLLIWVVILFFWLALPILLGLWAASQYFKAQMLGNAIRVSKDQYAEIHAIVEEHCRELKLNVVPEVFVINSQGATNAFAIKFLKDTYILLYSDLVDVMLAHGSTKELSSIIGHELGHHAAGHTAWWKKLLLKPAMFIPFFGAAYSRSCELTADRIGMYLCGDKDAACRGLVALACGSRVLTPQTSLAAFKEQEKSMPALFGFIHDLYSTHPRITTRVLELEQSAQLIAR